MRNFEKIADRKRTIATKNLCYKFAGASHWAVDWKIVESSNCDKNWSTSTEIIVVYLAYLVQINLVTCHALSDSDTRCLYVSAISKNQRMPYQKRL